jgi:phage N-6-adenine-methyltransferase
MTLLASAIKRLQEAAGKQLEADIKMRSGRGARTMPLQQPGKSEQIVGTPRDLLDAIEKRFGKMTFDLAATSKNCVVKGGKFHREFFGPGSGMYEDALDERAHWTDLKGNLWLNPPYANIKLWAEKCRHTSLGKPRGRIFLLIPASVGSNWWTQYVDQRAAVFFLSPRVTFVGHTSAYPKDIALCVYGAPQGYECWRWRS